MSDKKYIRIEELNKEHPLRQQPFTVPEGYFDTLPSRVQARIVKPKPSFTISWSWQRTVASLAGASLLAVLVWNTLPQRQESLGEESLSGVTDDAIKMYLEEQGVSTYDLSDNEAVQASFSGNASLMDYLDVKPEQIRKQIETQDISDMLNTES
ncbi:hypothetical protein GCM10023189_19880 [Nibrella saemangeumensis]|uniref:Anti sigma-E protein RseA N-terminal domain-containing protein n=1 Tax=Nibrella saemangeumensis TaxID=1084526 RepID=A0ABP8MTD0_9BACT